MTDRKCARCGEAIPASRNARAKYCSKSCQEHGARTLERERRRAALRCNHCNRPLAAGHSGAKYCSALCKERRRYIENREGSRRRNKNTKLRLAYGLTLEQYESLLVAQGGGCAACGAKRCRSGRMLHVDHDHETGAVRGLLCDGCNVALGHCADDPARLRALADYLELNSKPQLRLVS